MKALQIARQQVASTPTLSIVNCPIPTVKLGHALVKIYFSAVQPSDKLNAKGGFPKTTLPRIPGRDYAGEVVAVDHSSSSMTGWLGKKVCGTSNSELGFTFDGPHAEFCLIPEAMLVEKPRSLSLSQAATIGVPFTTALRCLTRARAGPGDIVLGAGRKWSCWIRSRPDCKSPRLQERFDGISVLWKCNTRRDTAHPSFEECTAGTNLLQ